jgi:hypothetical protein
MKITGLRSNKLPAFHREGLVAFSMPNNHLLDKITIQEKA